MVCFDSPSVFEIVLGGDEGWLDSPPNRDDKPILLTGFLGKSIFPGIYSHASRNKAALWIQTLPKTLPDHHAGWLCGKLLQLLVSLKSISGSSKELLTNCLRIWW